MAIRFHGTISWRPFAYRRDWDVDMQMDVTSLQTLAEEYNSTIWTAIPASAGIYSEPRDYLLDVNPFWMERVHGDGANFIDARFIDTRNGLYVDITALTELDPRNSPNLVSCKNFHNYRIQDLYPLQETRFEGTKAKVPSNYKGILADEYGKQSLLRAHFNSYTLSH
jgi:LicD family